MKWSLIYEKAIRDDGELYFPERLTHEFLQGAKRTMGTYLFANQYLNEVFPAEAQKFKRDWLKYYSQIPDDVYHFAFIDPAIGTSDENDYTGIVVVAVDCESRWFIKLAHRQRMTPSQIVNLVFEIQSKYQCMAIGIESVAYQKALIYMVAEEMHRRDVIVPLKDINSGPDKSKEQRILGLVPRFEWGHVLLNQGMGDFEKELLQFPRGAHDDIIDSLSQIETIVHYPQKVRKVNDEPHHLSSEFESNAIRKYVERANEENRYDE